MFLDGNMFAVVYLTNAWRLLPVLLFVYFVTPAFAAGVELQLENELLLELRLDGVGLGLDILGYQRGEEFLLSLDELTSAIRFPIEVDAVQGFASGWYISEDRTFYLDLERSLVTSDTNQWPINKEEVVVFEGDIFVEIEALEKWFPLELSAVIRELYLDVLPEETLPIQRRSERRERLISHSNSFMETQYPLQITPYKFFSPHITKLVGGYSTVRQNADSDAQYAINYATLSRGDLGWMTSTLSFAGQSSDSLSAAFVKLERSAFDGPLGLNHIELGDIKAGGLGFLISGGGNETKGERFDIETVSIEGSQLPDWDIELYQNDQLIFIQTTGQDGRYLFADLPLVFGENRFELKFFGPNGEFESREESHFLGAGMLEAGSVSYEVSAAQSGRTVLGVNNTDLASNTYQTAFNLGLSRNLTVGAGVGGQEVNGELLHTRNLRVDLSTSRFFSGVNYIDVPNGQNLLSTSLRTRIGDTSLNFGFTRFFNEAETSVVLRQWQSDIKITSSVFAVPVKFEANAVKQENSTLYGVVLGTTALLPGGGRLTSSLFYSSQENRSDAFTESTSRAGGQSSIYTSIRPWSFRLSAGYDLDSELELREVVADSILQIESDLSLDMSVSHNRLTDTVAYTGGVDWRLDKVAINASVGYDSNERWSGLITLSTTLLHRAGTIVPWFNSKASVDSGAVEVRVFEGDENGERSPYPEVGVVGTQAWRRATTDETGVALLSGLPAYRQIDVELDDSTITDYELRSQNPGVSVIARPGGYAIVKFPLIRTTELEGNVFLDDENKTPVSRALVSLNTLDGDVVLQTRTAYDGFYLFQGVEPGAYRLSLDTSFTQRIRSQPDEIAVQGHSGVISALDFSVGPAQLERRTLTSQSGSKSLQSATDIISSASIPPLLATSLPEPKSQPEPVTQPEPQPQSQQLSESQPSIELTNAGPWFVQLGAYNSYEIAQASWDRISQSVPALTATTARFSQYQAVIRLLVAPGLSNDAANGLCQRLKADGVDCFIRRVD